MSVDGRRGLSEILQPGPGCMAFTGPLQALQAAGYETTGDIVSADPAKLRKIEGVGPKTLKALQENIDDFECGDWLNETWNRPDPLERESTEITRCPACGKRLDEGERYDHLLNCPEATSGSIV